MSDNTAMKLEPEYGQRELNVTSDDPKDVNAQIERDLRALVKNPRCSEPLRAAIWKEIAALRSE